jgi:hypothetical protein
MNLRPSSVLLVAVSAAFAIGCTSNSPVCNPLCRSGFVCVSGTCVSACNPPCPTGQVCTEVGGNASCVAGDASASDAADALADGTTDAPGSDSPSIDSPTSDVPPLDAPGSDAPAIDGGSDVTTSDAHADTGPVDAAPPCGHAGQMCCSGLCVAGAECVGNTSCNAITPAAGECTRPADCTGGQVCRGPTTCGDRGCFTCGAAFGTGTIGGTCATGNDCQTGLCRGGQCTIPCAVGGTGNADCNAARSGWVCEELLYSDPLGDGAPGTVVALGVCRQGCQRAADCTGPAVCHAANNYTADSTDWICGTVTSTGANGSSCTDGSMCQSFVCAGGPTGGYCTVPCVSSADCPSTAPHCTPIFWYRPRTGGSQPGMACSP